MFYKTIVKVACIVMITCWGLQAQAQTKTISGQVVDDSTGEVISGATIKVKNGPQSAVSNMQGIFTMNIPAAGATLQYSHVGYEYGELKVMPGDNIKVSLKKQDNKLDEVVVIGYGTQRKSHLTGAVGTVNMGTIEDIPAGNLSETLRGQIPGVNVSGGFARPGQPATIDVRSPVFYSKDGGSKDPLYVIDDIVRTKADFDLLDVTEVENISVLKDAAAAIYGVLGANGVIIVKTKRGRAGKANVTYSGTYGTTNAIQMPKMLNAYQQANYLNAYYLGNANYDTAKYNANNSTFTQDELNYFKTAPSYNWLDMAFHSAHETRHTVNVSGGGENATYFAGLSYIDQNSNFDGLRYKRYTFRSSSDIRVAKGLKLGLSLSANLSDLKNTFNKQGGESLDNDWKTLITASPLYAPTVNGLPILIPNSGTNASINNYNYFGVHGANNYTSSIGTTVNFQGSLSYEFPFLKGLRASVNFNKNLNYAFGKQYGTFYNVYQFNMLGTHNHIMDTTYNKVYSMNNGDRIRLNPTYTNSYQLNGLLNYDRQFGKHHVGVLAGYEQSESFTDGVAGMVQGVLIGGYDNQNFATGAQTSVEVTSETGRLAYFGRLDYNYSNKYLLQFQFRADASPNFAPANRWGYFPSGSAGWVISEEPFFSGLKDVVNSLKLRFSLGHLGVDDTKAYQWLRNYGLYTSRSAVFGGGSDRGNAIATNLEIANTNVRWDDQVKYNGGIDAAFLRNRLTASVDGYLNHGYNMLSNLTSSPSFLIGAIIPSENFASINVFGVESSVGWKDRIGKDWGYNITVNFNWADNKQLIADVAALNKGTFTDPNGKSTDMGYLGYQYLGMFRTQADIDAYVAKYHVTKMLGYTVDQLKPGMLYYADVRGPQDKTTGQYAAPDGVIDVNDQTYIRNKQNNHYGMNFNWGVSYKSLALTVMTGMSWGGINAVESAATKVGNQTYINRPAFWSDVYTPDNPNAAYPNPAFSSTYDVPSAFWWKSSFTLRVTSLNLSYTLPQRIVRKAGFNSARFFLMAINPFNLYNPYSYKDNSQGSFDAFPQLKSTSLGLSVNL
ncbi:MAG: SusC/RagA family TonB-linked outer membrane protein [Niabella sp.]|nr:SusC/RagA family TonB-linked outer membrane protein [Niabella sp.]